MTTDAARSSARSAASSAVRGTSRIPRHARRRMSPIDARGVREQDHARTMSDSRDQIVFTVEEGGVYAGVLDEVLSGGEVPGAQRVQLLLLRDRLNGEFDGRG
ncbi:hypothetical protein B5P24_04620 [Clavibacter tessellarius]|uniref:Uncharacterized protein n=2 Tax=Clavibacter tessellarius TaxID=31965 RepID=A0A225C9D0_9MICO|nr:hypothetical protein B5P24_04620 [Clavibacter michiganensis subsp. tessellarius]